MLIAAAHTKKWTAFTPAVAFAERLRSGVHTIALLVSSGAVDGAARNRETAASEGATSPSLRPAIKQLRARPPSDYRFFDTLAIELQVQLADAKPFHDAAQTAGQEVRTLDPHRVAELLKDPHRLISEVGRRAIARFKRDAASAPHQPAAKPTASLNDAVSPTDGRERGYVVATMESAPVGAVVGSGDALRVLDKPLSSMTIAKVADSLHPRR